ncbi:MAG: AAA family ATPase [Lachnospiraceae bacterium]|nr:AAA family ATPase [Lachnospiraceae bacterium]
MKDEIRLSNIPSMSIGCLVEFAADAYCELIEGGTPLKTMPAIMLWGPPGVGKSQGVRQLAGEIEARTGKKTSVTDVRLLLFNPIDLRGIPVANEERTLAVWLKPRIFQMDESKDVINILFLDEISAAPQSVQAAAYQITLDRTVGEHKLPENCIVIAAGNRTTDRSVAVKMPKALANRMMHIEIQADLQAWRKWAVRSGINEKVVGFLSFREDALIKFNPASEDLAFPTPRSWEMVSNVLNYVSDDVDSMFPMISGLVGMAAASELRSWTLVYRDLPDVEDIFSGKEADIPKAPDALYALTSAMSAYAVRHKEDLQMIRNSICYAGKMPPDFSVMLMKDYMSIEKGYLKKLMGIPEFARWMETKGRLLNGSF